jgi:hypothetical protein
VETLESDISITGPALAETFTGFAWDLNGAAKIRPTVQKSDREIIFRNPGEEPEEERRGVMQIWVRERREEWREDGEEATAMNSVSS